MKNEKKWMLKYLGERFKFFRKEKGYTREEAGTFIGVSSRTIGAYERGEREISINATEKMAACYGVTFEVLTDYKRIYKKMKEAIKNGELELDRPIL